MSSLLHGVSVVTHSSWGRYTLLLQLSSCATWQDICCCFNKTVLLPLKQVKWNLPERALALSKQLHKISFKNEISLIIENTKKLAPSLFQLALGLNKFFVESCIFLAVLVCSFFILHFLCSWIIFLFKSLITAWSSAATYIFGRIFGDDDASKRNRPLPKVQHSVQLVSTQRLDDRAD